MAEPEGPTKKVPSARRRHGRFLFVVIPVALLASVAVIFAGGTFGQGSEQGSKDTEAPGEAEGPQAGADLEHPSLGDEDAPVVMVEYGDFQCPNCGKFARDIEPELLRTYVKNGTLRMEWRDFPYLGQESVNAALAGRAAQEQGKFWEYHDLLYNNQKSPNSGAFSDAKLAELAGEVGLDVEDFKSELASGNYEQDVAQDLQEGQSRGIAGTPTFFINGKVLVGAQPVEVFQEAIEQAAREAQHG